MTPMATPAAGIARRKSKVRVTVKNWINGGVVMILDAIANLSLATNYSDRTQNNYILNSEALIRFCPQFWDQIQTSNLNRVVEKADRLDEDAHHRLLEYSTSPPNQVNQHESKFPFPKVPLP